MNANIEHTHQFFTFDHLPEPLRSVSARFAAAADAVYADSDCGRAAVKSLHAWLLDNAPCRPPGLETVMCMRKMHVALNPGLDMAAQYDDDVERELVLRMLLEAKDCAVRAMVAAKPTIITHVCYDRLQSQGACGHILRSYDATAPQGTAPTCPGCRAAWDVQEPAMAAARARHALSEPIVEMCAELAHEINRAYCTALGDASQVPWDEAPEWQRESARLGVRFKMADPTVTPEQSHESWLATKAVEGWAYGPVKDVEAKLHPCFVPYSELPPEQRVKDYLFLACVQLGQRLRRA